MNKLSDLRALPLRQDEVIIHEARDDHGRILVIDDGNHRILSFDSIFEQSCMRLSQRQKLVHEYTQLMILALAFIEPRRITLFGLGGGSLLRSLHHLLPECLFTVVELRQAVADVATRYFSLPVDQRVDMRINDALTEISRLEDGSSEIVFSDMYSAYEMEPGQLQETFLNECARILTPDGWLVLNVHAFPGGFAPYLEMLSSLFPTVMLGSTADNSVLLASNGPADQVAASHERIELMERMLQQRFAQLLPRLKPFGFRLNV